MNYKEFQTYRKTKRGLRSMNNNQQTFSQPSAKRAPQKTKSKNVNLEVRQRCIATAVETMQVKLDRFTMQDLLEKHGFEKHGGFWI